MQHKILIGGIEFTDAEIEQVSEALLAHDTALIFALFRDKGVLLEQGEALLRALANHCAQKLSRA